MYNLEEQLKFARYVTAEFTRLTPIYDWFSFPHSFSKELVHELLDSFGATVKDWVLDPYVGAGTTLLACQERSIPAVGIDELPLSVFVSNTKVQSYDVKTLESRLLKYRPFKPKNDVFGSVPVVDKAFTPEVRQKISEIYTWAYQIPPTEKDFFVLALLSILEELSQTTKSGGWLRIIEKNINSNKVEEIYKTKVRKMIDDLKLIKPHVNTGEWYAISGDARKIIKLEHPIHFVITSPPYLNRHDYTRVFALEMALHFVKTNMDLISIRSQALRSHVEAKPLNDLEITDYRQPQRLVNIIQKIKSSSNKTDCVRVPRMVKGYFEDMYASLKSISLVIEKGGSVAFVLGNVRFSGVMIPVDEIVAEIGEQVGLTVKKIIVARYRGNSAQQMKEYGRVPSRESVIIWEKAK